MLNQITTQLIIDLSKAYQEFFFKRREWMNRKLYIGDIRKEIKDNPMLYEINLMEQELSHYTNMDPDIAMALHLAAVGEWGRVHEGQLPLPGMEILNAGTKDQFLIAF